MVRAILADHKTVMRRIVKPAPYLQEVAGSYGGQLLCFPDRKKKGRGLIWPNAREAILEQCPYGQPGDRMWVRETWGVISNSWDEDGGMIAWHPDRPATPIREMPFGNGYYSGHVIYAADGPCEWAGDDDGGGEPRSAWKPSIHMPRAASRITLEVTGVSVERLQDIGEEQAKAEGIPPGGPTGRSFGIPGMSRAHYLGTAQEAFTVLWDQINGAGSWDANPWVWAVEFRRLEGAAA